MAPEAGEALHPRGSKHRGFALLLGVQGCTDGFSSQVLEKLSEYVQSVMVIGRLIFSAHLTSLQGIHTTS